jgi:hypothetical protein
MTPGTSVENETHAKRPHATFSQIRPAFQKNGLTHVVSFTHATCVPSDVFAYGREAPNCFEQRRYLATIVLASAEVEVILNKDIRMQRQVGGWRTLTMKLLREAKRKGLPVELLLGAGESFDRTVTGIEFIELRNRIAHGNLSGMLGFEHNGTPDYSPAAKEAAFNHLRKAEEFFVGWFNTSPDVQENRIRHHRWPK